MLYICFVCILRGNFFYSSSMREKVGQLGINKFKSYLKYIFNNKLNNNKIIITLLTNVKLEL